MHRFLGRFVIGAGALLITATAQAQDTQGRPFKLGGSLGATLPLGDFGDGADLGFHVGGLIEYKPAAFPINLRGEITYHRNSLKDEFFDEFPLGNVDGNTSMLTFIGNALFPFGDPASTARPYAIAGLGLYRVGISGDVEGSNFDLDDTQTKFGLNVGGGFTFNLSGFETFVEARFHSVFTEVSNRTFIPLSFGFKF